MTSNFDAYAAYYDLLYRDKDYRGEAQYVDELIQRHAPGARHVLELGSGTGKHAVELVALGYEVSGIDRSEKMVSQARSRLESHYPGYAGRFYRGDMRDYRSGTTFDAVVSLFHVMSYQVRNEDVIAALTTAYENLRPGGLFVFDCWYGPGVLTDPPAVRARRMAQDGISVTRIAEPEMHFDLNRVDVRYDVFVESQNATSRIQEVHPMRYFFLPEMEFFLSLVGFQLVASKAWLYDRAPETNWHACIVAKR